RKQEVLNLRWDDVDPAAGELRLRDSKTGWRSVPLTPAVAHVFAGIPRRADNPWVITGQKRGSRLQGLDDIWQRLRRRAGLEDVRIHDCRHSYASRALALGESLTMIGRLLGHAKIGTTARYAHLARDTEKASAARVGGSIGAAVLPDAA
ncbi:MAG: site-specific integrase, partial [Rhodospirillales bacterium]|nr:site-specific integrase [Rhodospirillales bacterium]